MWREGNDVVTQQTPAKHCVCQNKRSPKSFVTDDTSVTKGPQVLPHGADVIVKGNEGHTIHIQSIWCGDKCYGAKMFQSIQGHRDSFAHTFHVQSRTPCF